ncbi:MAG: SH3 domain-containing protein [Acidimicrobiales bacterium]
MTPDQRRSPARPFRLGLAVTAALLTVGLLVGCGDDGDAADDTTTLSSDEPTTTTSGGTTTTTGTSTSASSETTGPTSTTLPGSPVDGFAADGDVLAVMGVAHDDVLNVRAIPGTAGDIVATAAPTADDLVATGEARQLDSSIWYQVEAGGTTGWVSSSFVGFLGDTDDATAEFVGDGDLPETETMLEMGELVADHFATDDPASLVVQSVAPSVGDLGEITFDVVGIGDDSVAGYRLHVFATPSESGEGFVLKSIERTVFCARGVDGLVCV